MNRSVLLSFDVEEFDMPLEYNFPISANEQMEVGKRGLDTIDSILCDPSIQSTLFTTANFAMQYPETIKLHAQKHEIASHTFYHSNFKEEDLKLSKNKLEEILNEFQSKEMNSPLKYLIKYYPDISILILVKSFSTDLNFLFVTLFLIIVARLIFAFAKM